MTNELKVETDILPAGTAPRRSVIARMVAKVILTYTLGVESPKTAKESAIRGIPLLDEAGISTSHLPDNLVKFGNATSVHHGSLETPVVVGKVNDSGQMEDGTAWSIIEVKATRPAVVSQYGSEARVIMVHIFDPGRVLSEEPIRHVVARLGQGNVHVLPALPENKDLERAA